jgi:dihydropteroate synthase
VTAVFGILNLTPDSFSDGGRNLAPGAALDAAARMLAQGADVIDVGGESTRPGATPVPADVEADRVLAVVHALSCRGATVSIDTVHASTAAAALRRGASIVNDVSGGLADHDMAGVVADSTARYVIGHWRGNPRTMDGLASYTDPVDDVVRELSDRVDDAVAKGVRPERIIVDPGLGFAKAAAHDWALLAALDRVSGLGFPVMIGASRKRFLADVVPAFATLHERDQATSSITLLAARLGVWAVRVHDVAGSVTALSTLSAVTAATRHPTIPPGSPAGLE